MVVLSKIVQSNLARLCILRWLNLLDSQRVDGARHNHHHGYEDLKLGRPGVHKTPHLYPLKLPTTV